ncbi:hypothetical protein CCP4SC76_2470008 [Gammaproteobacteria bacterium]
MPDDRFDVFFSGVCLPGQDPVAVRERVRRLFKTSDAQLTALFSGQPVAVKKGLDMEAAGKYRAAFRDIGALVTIRRAGDTGDTGDTGESSAKPVPPPHPVPPPLTAVMTLLPARTGSLATFAPPVNPAALPDISRLNMADPRRPLDETPPPPPLVVDTRGLSVDSSGSLEAFATRVTPAPIPDISRLNMADPRRPLDETSPPPPLVVDTRGLSVAAGGWSLADCAVAKPPQAIPDLGHLTLAAEATKTRPRD